MFDNSGEIEALKLVITTLKEENEHLRARLVEFEHDERETRRGLLTRLGVLAPAGATGEPRKGPEPVRKATVPWHTQAAKLEADSRQRYWESKIKEAEKPQEQRQAEAESAEEAADIEELSK